MKFFLKIIFSFLVILMIGGIGGVLAERLFLSYLSQTIPLNKISWLRQVQERMTIINKTERITIAENTAVEEAIDRVKPAIVGVVTKKSADKSEQVVAAGSGFILTADGLIVTANYLLPAFKLPERAKYYIVKDEKLISAKLVKRDSVNNLALLQIQESNLPVVSLGNIEELRLGQRVVLLGTEIQKNNLDKFVNLGTIRNINNNGFLINLERETWMINGGPLINVKGEVIGLIWLDKQGGVKISPTGKIKDLLNQLNQ